jgi:hypothetical protein
MRNAKEFLPLVSLDPRQAEVLIELIQKDAYNSAIKDAIENVTASIEYEYWGNTGSEHCDESAVVNHESIFNLMKK